MNTNIHAKRVLCYGDSNSWGWVPSSMGLKRFNALERWPGILQELLGKDYEIIEEGLGGRTTMFDDPRPEFPERNGLKTLPIILESHLPLDFVIVMLGTTDTKEMMHLSSQQIAEGMHHLIQGIKKYKVLKGFSAPKILVVVPPIVREEAIFASKLFKGSSAKGKDLIERYRQLAETEQILFLDATKEIIVDKDEGVHIDANNHQRLARLIYKKIKE